MYAWSSESPFSDVMLCKLIFLILLLCLHKNCAIRIGKGEVFPHSLLSVVPLANPSVQAGRHKFVKISPPIMIFHTRHSHSVADRLSSKSLVRGEWETVLISFWILFSFSFR